MKDAILMVFIIIFKICLMAFIFIHFEFIYYFQEVYKEQQVIFCTLSSSTVRKLSKFGWHPDIIVIGRFGQNSFFFDFCQNSDEAAQCTEPATWAAIIHAPRCILVGDFQQLPTIVISKA